MKCLPVLAVLAAWFLGAGLVRAETVTWGGGTGDWFNSGNWSPPQIPSNGDDVVINSGAVLLTNQAGLFGQVTLGGGTLTFSNWMTQLAATNVTVNGGAIDLPKAFTNGVMSNRVWIVCTNLTVAAGAAINADFRGYGAFTGPGTGVFSASRAGGAGYGGRGANGAIQQALGGMPYGAAANPTEPGSGGGTTGNGPGTPGGGVIRIEASDHVLVNGTVSANGSNMPAAYIGQNLANIGCGSGGGIFIRCRTFGSTNGLIQAKGGNGDTNTYGGAGGGGRIAISYDPVSQSNMSVPSVRLLASAGTSLRLADAGTIWLPDNRFLTANLTNFAGQLLGFTSWSPSSLLVSNNWIRFAEAGFQLTVAGDVQVKGSSGRLDLGGGGLLQDIGYANDPYFAIHNSGSGAPVIQVGGSLSVTNGGKFYVNSASTNPAVSGYGALVSVTGDIVVASNSWIYAVSNPTNGGSALFRMRGLTIGTNGGVSANFFGFRNAAGYGKGTSSSRASGGAYGGKGGNGSDGTLGGQPYGSSNAPMDCGSGGGMYGTPATRAGGRGGGLIRMTALGAVRVEGGSLLANGESYVETATGAGSGGGINLTCSRLFGYGVIQAKGGNGDLTHSGGGGGGRIEIRCTAGPNMFRGAYSVTNGTGWSNGVPGSLVLEAAPGAVLMLVR